MLSLLSSLFLTEILPTEDGLPDLPEESMVKKDPCEEGETPMSPTSPSLVSGIAGISVSEQATIKANKGMILRKVPFSRSHAPPSDPAPQSVEYIRYLQQLVSVQASRGRDLEERNKALERELAMLRGSSSSSSSPSVASSQVLSMSSASSITDARLEDLEMEDVLSAHNMDQSRGRQLGRVRDKIHGMMI